MLTGLEGKKESDLSVNKEIVRGKWRKSGEFLRSW